MSSPTYSLSERVSSSFNILSIAAANLNAASDELAKSITSLESAFKQLNLGISSWVTATSSSDETGLFYSLRQIGYDRIDGKWGIALRTVSGREDEEPGQERTESWLFNDGPRSLRLEVIDKLPDLIETLAKEAAEAAEKIKKKASQTQAIATAIIPLAKTESKARK